LQKIINTILTFFYINFNILRYFQTKIKMAHQEVTTSAEVQKFLDANGGIAVVDAFAT